MVEASCVGMMGVCMCVWFFKINFIEVHCRPELSRINESICKVYSDNIIKLFLMNAVACAEQKSLGFSSPNK